MNLVYVHIGKTLPDYIYDSVYQTLLINRDLSRIYVIIDDCLKNEFEARVSKFNLVDFFKDKTFDILQHVHVVEISRLQGVVETNSLFNDYKQALLKHKHSIDLNFREKFWISTTARFFYIEAFLELYQLENVFHIENDIMMYISFTSIYNTITRGKSDNMKTNIWMVQDSPQRVVPSLLFFPDAMKVKEMNAFIVSKFCNSINFMNDMDLLGSFTRKMQLPIFPEPNNLIFDGAAIGQYLGGVDVRNTNCPSEFENNSVGFINETSVFKPNTCDFFRLKVQTDIHSKPIDIYVAKNKQSHGLSSIANLHIHSKQLNLFSSVNSLQYNDIISGERILSLCDVVLLSRPIYNFHKNLQQYVKDIIIIKDWENVNTKKLEELFRDIKKENAGEIKLGLYTHELDMFINKILPYLTEEYKYILYIHNSDHSFNTSHKILVEHHLIKHIYAQNIDYPYMSGKDKLTLLPIGIANSMWGHGDIKSLYRTMKKSYMNKKSRNIYVNINPNTYQYRHELLQQIKKTKNFELSVSKPYVEYLQELSTYRFCLCIRGNGLDTHRFWECLYLGVIPVIINNKHTNCEHFVEYLRDAEVPFLEIVEDSVEEICQKYNEEYYNDGLYTKMLLKYTHCFYNNKNIMLYGYGH
jgi:hypothetical protein